MSRRSLAVPLLLVLLAVPVVAQAQVYVFLGGGPTFPNGDYGNYAKTGWIAHAGVGVPVGPAGLSVGLDAFYGQNNHSDVDGDKTNPYGAMGFAQYRFGNPERPGVYAYGEAGLLVHKYGSDTFSPESNSQFALGGGVGVDFPLGGGKSIWVEGAYTNSDGTNFITAQAGIALGL